MPRRGGPNPRARAAVSCAVRISAGGAVAVGREPRLAGMRAHLIAIGLTGAPLAR